MVWFVGWLLGEGCGGVAVLCISLVGRGGRGQGYRQRVNMFFRGVEREGVGGKGRWGAAAVVRWCCW